MIVSAGQLAALQSANRNRRKAAQVRRDETLRALAAKSKCLLCGGGMLVRKREVRCSLCDARRKEAKRVAK